MDEIANILGLNKTNNAIIVGAGNLGQAIANYSGFRGSGFILKGMFDINPRLVGISIRDIKIMDIDEMSEFIKKAGYKCWHNMHSTRRRKPPTG